MEIEFRGTKFKPTLWTYVRLMFFRRAINGYFTSLDFPRKRFFLQIENKPYYMKWFGESK